MTLLVVNWLTRIKRQFKINSLKNYIFKALLVGAFLIWEIGDYKALSAVYNNFGVLHEIDSALNFYQKGLKIVEELNDIIGIFYSLNNITRTYVFLGNYIFFVIIGSRANGF